MSDPLKFPAAAIKPKRNVVLVRLLKGPDKSDGGILLPETEQAKRKAEHKLARVLAVGPGKWDDEWTQRLPVDAAVGDLVICDPPYMAPVRGHDDLFLIEDDAILAGVDPEQPREVA